MTISRLKFLIGTKSRLNLIWLKTSKEGQEKCRILALATLHFGIPMLKCDLLLDKCFQLNLEAD